MTKDIPVSGWMMVQDEEAYIERAIKNLSPNVGEIIVIDGGSKDKTIKIAKDLGCTVFRNKFEFDFAKQRNYALGKCENDWTITLDADEIFSEDFYKLLPTLVMKPPENCVAYNVWRISVFDDKKVGEEYQPRVMNKKFCYWNGKIHEQLIAREKGLFNLPKEFCMTHSHSMKRQIWSNALYRNMNKNINKRPNDNEGCEEQSGKLINIKTERNG